ncbi:MAG: hypothetical protein ABI456_10625 [Ktedonobacteraceae bacterium]|nr:hypothetical protein [Chloroflexota bacterium]
MNNFPTRSLETPTRNTQVPVYLTSKPQEENRILQWWYRLAAPPEPARSASFKEMERFRRGTAGSQIILALYLLLITSVFASFVGTNEYLIPIVIGSAIALTVATVLNRLGQITLAGTLVVLTFAAFPMLSIVSTPGGLSMLVLPLFALLVLPLLCAASFLPPGWVFVVALGNCLFTWFSLTVLPRTAELDAILAIAFAGIMLPIIFSQFIVSIVAYAWVQGTTRALIRANHAEEIARLEHDLGLQAAESAQQKQQLEASVQQIVETHIRVANGDWSARVPLTRENILWQISGPLNNLLARTQRWRQEAEQLQQARMAIQQVRNENEQLRRALGGNPMQNPPRSTTLKGWRDDRDHSY